MSIVRQMHGQLAPVLSIVRKRYFINECFLMNLGFKRNETLSCGYEWVYRYESTITPGNGLELLFLQEYGIVTIKEFWAGEGTECCSAHSLIGEFRINADEDLEFIFTKNVRLNFIFHVANRRV